MEGKYRYEVRARTRCRTSTEAEQTARGWVDQTGGIAVVRLPLRHWWWIPALGVVARYGAGR